MRRSSGIVVIAFWLAAAPLVAQGQPPAPRVLLPTRAAPLELEAGTAKIRVALVTDGLKGPWDIAFLPDGTTILVTESPGALRLVRDGTLEPEPVWIAPSPQGNDVLHGLVIHPDFAENRFVYASYTKQREDGLLTLAISRGRLERVDAVLLPGDAADFARHALVRGEALRRLQRADAIGPLARDALQRLAAVGLGDHPFVPMLRAM